MSPEATPSVSPQTMEPPRAPPPPAPTPAMPPPVTIPSPAPRALPPPDNDQFPPDRTAPAAQADAAYAHSATVWLSPRVLRWVAPAALVALVALLILPWTGAYPGGHRVYSQNAFQTIWGGVSVDPTGAEALGHGKPYDEVEGDWMMLLYALLIVSALALVLAPLWFTTSRVQALRPRVQSLWGWRLGLAGALALTAFVLLSVQLWTGFGLEAASADKADRDRAGELAAAKNPAERNAVEIHRKFTVGPFGFRRTLWLRLAVLAHVLALGGLGAELWLQWRGARPLPRIDVRT